MSEQFLPHIAGDAVAAPPLSAVWRNMCGRTGKRSCLANRSNTPLAFT